MNTLLLLVSLLAPNPAPDTSVYLLGHHYRAASGGTLALDAFKGGPVVISMFYGTCPHVCPMLLRDIARLVDAAPAEARSAIQVVLLSFDGERDTPASLTALAAKHGLDPAQFHMALGTPDAVRELAAVLGIRYRRLPDGSIGHTSVITVLDDVGRIVDRFEGAGKGVLALLPALTGKR